MPHKSQNHEKKQAYVMFESILKKSTINDELETNGYN